MGRRLSVGLRASHAQNGIGCFTEGVSIFILVFETMLISVDGPFKVSE